MGKLSLYESPQDTLVDEYGDVYSSAGEVSELKDWTLALNKQHLELDHPRHEPAEPDESVDAIDSTEGDAFISSVRDTNYRGPGFKTKSMRNARAHEIQARIHRGW